MTDATNAVKGHISSINTTAKAIIAAAIEGVQGTIVKL